MSSSPHQAFVVASMDLSLLSDDIEPVSQPHTEREARRQERLKAKLHRKLSKHMQKTKRQNEEERDGRADGRVPSGRCSLCLKTICLKDAGSK